MKRKVPLSAIILIALTTIFPLTALLTRNAYCPLLDPEVDVIPPAVCVGQQVVVKAKVSVWYG